MKITQLRKAKGITQAALAERCAMTQQQIARLENGSVDPRLGTLRRIASALDCELPDLFFTRDEFLRTIREVAAAHHLDLGDTPVLELNSLCSQERHVPSFDPLWEEVVFKAGKISLKKGTKNA